MFSMCGAGAVTSVVVPALTAESVPAHLVGLVRRFAQSRGGEAFHAVKQRCSARGLRGDTCALGDSDTGSTAHGAMKYLHLQDDFEWSFNLSCVFSSCGAVHANPKKAVLELCVAVGL